MGQDLDISANPVSEIAYPNFFVRAVKPCEVALSHDERIKSKCVIRYFPVVLCVGTGNHQARHCDNITAGLKQTSLYDLKSPLSQLETLDALMPLRGRTSMSSEANKSDTCSITLSTESLG